MTHPSIVRARELLANRDLQEAEYAIWRAEHADELDRIETEMLITRRAKLTVLHKTLVDEDHQGLEFRMSTRLKDRMGDVIEQNWDLTHFNGNPICPFNHNLNFVVGRWGSVGVRNDALHGHLHLAPQGSSARIDEIRSLVAANIIRAVSVGFRPISSEPLPDGGTRFTRSELVECSLVSTPANPEALAVAKSLRVSDETLQMVFTPQPTTPLEALADMIGEETGKAANDIRKLQIEIEALRGQLAVLRAEEILRG